MRWLQCVAACLLLFGCLSGAQAGSYEDFFRAIVTDDTAVVRDLLRRGFDPNTRDPSGQDPLYLALRQPALKVAEVLVTWPKTKVDLRNQADETPLMMAALKGHVDLARALIVREADVNKPGWTPLHYAATSGHVAMIELLLDNHAYIDAESPNGSTPLMMAARYGSLAAVQALLDAGADSTIKNQLGMTAIDFANSASRPDVADLIAQQHRKQRPAGKW